MLKTSTLTDAELQEALGVVKELLQKLPTEVSLLAVEEEILREMAQRVAAQVMEEQTKGPAQRWDWFGEGEE